MFHSARIKLTLWYLLIIMAISISFSVVIYIGVAREVDRAVRIETFRIQQPLNYELYIQRPVWDFDTLPRTRLVDPKLIAAARLRVVESLAGINLIILFFSSLAGYFLAGRTLRPIKNMVDEQNRFVTDASHELNTPLTSLKTSLEVNLRDKNLNLRKAKDVLTSNLEEVNNLSLLSGELIKLTQYQKPNGNFQLQKVSLQEIINAAVIKINPLAKKKNIEINITGPDVFINADSRSLAEVFVILLDNAVKYSNNGKNILVSVKKIDSKVRIGVKDNGFGIGKEDLPYIFDRFYRTDKSRTKQQTPGYGLGLSIAKRIIILHKGMITTESILGKGTAFIITLPIF